MFHVNIFVSNPSYCSICIYIYGITYYCSVLHVQSGQSPLWVASGDGHLKCVELLINAGANVDMQDEVSVSNCTHLRD